MLPVTGLMVHFGFVPKPFAVNCWVLEGLRDAALGLTLIAGVVERVMLAVAV
jgi:hypothetical protein